MSSMPGIIGSYQGLCEALVDKIELETQMLDKYQDIEEYRKQMLAIREYLIKAISKNEEEWKNLTN